MPTMNLLLSDTSYLCIFGGVLVIHLIEEFWGGTRSQDPHKLRGLDLSRKGFIRTNLVVLALFGGYCVLALKLGFPQFLLVSLATFVLINATSHAVTSIKGATYSPGLVTGLFAFLPLGAFTLIRLKPAMSNVRFGAAIAAGLGMQFGASFIAHRGRQLVIWAKRREAPDSERELLGMESESIVTNENLKG